MSEQNNATNVAIQTAAENAAKAAEQAANVTTESAKKNFAKSAKAVVKRCFTFAKYDETRVSVELANALFVGLNEEGEEIEQNYFTMSATAIVRQLAEYDDLFLYWESKLNGQKANPEIIPLILTRSTIEVERVLKLAGEKRSEYTEQTFDRNTYVTVIKSFVMGAKAPFLQNKIVELIETQPTEPEPPTTNFANLF